MSGDARRNGSPVTLDVSLRLGFRGFVRLLIAWAGIYRILQVVGTQPNFTTIAFLVPRASGGVTCLQEHAADPPFMSPDQGSRIRLSAILVVLAGLNLGGGFLMHA